MDARLGRIHSWGNDKHKETSKCPTPELAVLRGP